MYFPVLIIEGGLITFMWSGFCKKNRGGGCLIKGGGGVLNKRGGGGMILDAYHKKLFIQTTCNLFLLLIFALTVQGPNKLRNWETIIGNPL